MKSLLWVFVLAVVAFAAGYTLCFRLSVAPELKLVEQADGQTEWLRQEFHLDAAQVAAVRQVDADFAPQTEQMYQQLNSAFARAQPLIETSHSLTPEVDAVLKECVHLQEESYRAALQHVYAVAAKLPPTEGDRYIKVLQPHILEPSLRPAQITRGR